MAIATNPTDAIMMSHNGNKEVDHNQGKAIKATKKLNRNMQDQKNRFLI